MAYIPLWCKSNFSFLEGASHPAELVERAHAQGLSALALTDRDGVQGVVRAHMKARELGVKLIIGSQVTVADPGVSPTLSPQEATGVGPRDQTSTLTLLAQDREGYANLCRLITRGRLRNPKGHCRVTWQEVCQRATGLIALWGGRGSLLSAEAPVEPIGHSLKDAFGDRLYGLLTRHHEAEESRAEQRLRKRCAQLGLPLVASTEVLYHDRSRRDLQDVMTCVRHGVTLPTAGRLTRPNAEHDLLTAAAFHTRFSDDHAAAQRTAEIGARCTFDLGQIRYRYPSERLPSGKTSAQWLRQLTLEGARRRYDGEVPGKVLSQLDKELSLIDELDYCGYFLTMWELVRFCNQEGILCQGRGSAANSAVCFCLGITAVDPTRVDLLFERFLSRERAEPPDIDLDIMHARREEAIQHVYNRYGRDHSAMVANVIRYRTRSAVREVGKVLGLSETAVDRLAKLSSGYGGALDAEALAHTGLDAANPVHGHLVRLVEQIQDFPRHLSIHPGGFLLGHEPVHDLVPIENGAMQDRTVIQWDKDDLEDLGLFKVDLLGLGALTQLKGCFDLLKNSYGKDLSMADIPEADPLTYACICAADTVGVFQIESRAQMAMLPRLRPRNYYDLVVEISIVRPGPITGGMVHPYLRRRDGLEPVIYPHACLEPVLAKTLGVPLFQEQVMQLAMVAADYTPGEADQLRRDMAAWRRSGRIEGHRERLITRMVAKGIEQAFAERVFEQIKGFGEYGFPESHAASFALIAYATSYLKAHYPDVFLCALLNAQPMGFYTPATLIEDAGRHGVEVRAADVSHSDWMCTLEPQQGDGPDPGAAPFAVRMGLRFIKGLSESRDWAALEQARKTRAFTSIDDLTRRSGLDAKALTRLAEAGALSSLCGTRRSALWQVQGAASTDQQSLDLSEGGQTPEFQELSAFDSITWDYRTSGHSARGHPLAPLRPQLAAQGLPDARGLLAMRDGRRASFAGLVICRQRPGTASGVTFLTLEDETGFVNAVVWKQVYEQHRVLLKTSSLLGISGRIQSEQGVVHLIAERLWQPDVSAAPATAGSRDFR